MAYFNHAFCKVFLGTSTNSQANPKLNNGISVIPPVAGPLVPGGFITTSGVSTAELAVKGTPTAANNFGPGTYGFFDPSTWQSVDTSFFGPAGQTQPCCPLILASASLMNNDKVGPFHGGYQESNKSKMINPKYLQKAYRVNTCVPQQSVISIGNTPQTRDGIATTGVLVGGTGYLPATGTAVFTTTGGTGSGATVSATIVGGIITAITIVNNGSGYTAGDILTIVGGNNDATFTVVTIVSNNLDPNDFQGGTNVSQCCYEFFCDETYYLRVDIKGSPALRFLNHNAYQTLSAYTGCCDGPVPTLVDSTLVMISWAQAMVENEYLTNLALPVVFDEAGAAWYAPGTTVDPITGLAIPVIAVGPNTGQNQTWNYYISPGHVAGQCAGLRLFGAYVETKFGNCSFQTTDFFEKEPVRLYASLVDYNGDPCVFEGICVYNDCRGVQGMGFGEQVVRDLILSESYLQNFFATDIRTREITQGDQILNAIDRNALYTRYFLLHSVPRFNNPSGTFDNDRYLLEIIVTEFFPLTPVGNPPLEVFLNAWFAACPNCVSLEIESCTRCINLAGN